MSDLIRREDAIKAMEQRYQDILRIFKRKVKDGEKAIVLDMIGCIKTLPSADRPQGEWIDCKEPPSTDRNVFIAYGTDNMKSVCIGHYEHGMKMWYEDKNFFAEPLYGGMYWCEIPQFPTRMKGADDEEIYRYGMARKQRQRI